MKQAIKELPIKLRIQYYAYSVVFNAFVFFMIFAFAFILDKHIEAFFLLVAYGFVRYKFPTTFHHDSIYWCAFWSILSMWICIFTTLPLSASILSSIIVAVILCYILYKVQKSVDTKKELALTLEENERLQTANQELLNAKPKEFSLKTCSEKELRARCRELGISIDSTEIAVEYFVNKSSNIWGLAIKHSIDYDSMKRRIHRIKKKLEA